MSLNDHLSLITHHLSLTTYHSLLTTYHLSLTTVSLLYLLKSAMRQTDTFFTTLLLPNKLTLPETFYPPATATPVSAIRPHRIHRSIPNVPSRIRPGRYPSSHL